MWIARLAVVGVAALALSTLSFAGTASPYFVGFGKDADPGNNIVRVQSMAGGTGVCPGATCTLQTCAQTAGNICIFDQCGIIDMGSTDIDIASNVWIAGQTCPDNGSGIVILGDKQTFDYQVSKPSDVVFQSLMVLPDFATESGYDCDQGWGTTIQTESTSPAERHVFDHMFFVFNFNKPVSIRGQTTNVTFSNSVFGPGVWTGVGAGTPPNPTKTDEDGCTNFTGPYMIPTDDSDDDVDTTIFRSILHGSTNRQPKWGGGRYAQFINNLSSWWYNGFVAGEFVAPEAPAGYYWDGVNYFYVKGNIFVPFVGEGLDSPTRLGEFGGVQTRMWFDAENLGPWCGTTWDYTLNCWTNGGGCVDSSCAWDGNDDNTNNDFETYWQEDSLPVGFTPASSSVCENQAASCAHNKAYEAAPGGANNLCIGSPFDQAANSCIARTNQTDCCWDADSAQELQDKFEAEDAAPWDAAYDIPSAQYTAPESLYDSLLADVGPRKHGSSALYDIVFDDYDVQPTGATFEHPWLRYRTYGLCTGTSLGYGTDAGTCWWGGEGGDPGEYDCAAGQDCVGFCYRIPPDSDLPGKRRHCTGTDVSPNCGTDTTSSFVKCTQDSDCNQASDWKYCTMDATRGWTEPVYNFTQHRTTLNSEVVAGTTWQGQAWTDGSGAEFGEASADGMNDYIEEAIWGDNDGIIEAGELSTTPSGLCTVLESQTTKPMGATWSGDCAHEYIWRQMDPTGDLYLSTPAEDCSPDCYVDDTGGDDGASGKIGAPFATIQYCMDQAVPGDTCWIREGTYNEWVVLTASGTSGNPITMQNFTGETPTIDGTGVSVDAFWGLLDTADESYIVIDGMEITNSSRICVRGGSAAGGGRDVTFQNLTVSNCTDSGIQYEENDQTVVNLRVLNNTVTTTGGAGIWVRDCDFGVVLIEGNTVSDVDNTANLDAIQFNDTDNIVIRQNTVFDVPDNAGDGGQHIDVGGRDPGALCQVDPDVFCCTADNVPAGCCTGNGTGTCEPENVLIEDNVVYWVTSASTEGVKLNNEAKEAIIRRNKQFDLGFSFYEPPFTDVYIYHNTTVVEQGGNNAVTFYQQNDVAFADVLLKNNFWGCYTGTYCLLHHPDSLAGDFNEIGFDNDIYHPNVQFALWRDTGGELIITPGQYESVWRTTLSQEPSGTGFITASGTDVLFVDEPNRDVTPLITRVSSALIDAGAALTTTAGVGGTNNLIDVTDAGWFWAGLPAVGSPGDTIVVGDDTVTITSISGNQLTVSESITWAPGENVYLPYSGSAPDVGAIESEYVSGQGWSVTGGYFE